MSDAETNPTEFPVDMTIEVRIDARDIVTKLKPIQVVDLVAELDDESNDWTVTLLLYRHFEEQYKAAVAAGLEEANWTEEQLENDLNAVITEEQV